LVVWKFFGICEICAKFSVHHTTPPSPTVRSLNLSCQTISLQKSLGFSCIELNLTQTNSVYNLVKPARLTDLISNKLELTSMTTTREREFEPKIKVNVSWKNIIEDAEHHDETKETLTLFLDDVSHGKFLFIKINDRWRCQCPYCETQLSGKKLNTCKQNTATHYKSYHQNRLESAVVRDSKHDKDCDDNDCDLKDEDIEELSQFKEMTIVEKQNQKYSNTFTNDFCDDAGVSLNQPFETNVKMVQDHLAKTIETDNGFDIDGDYRKTMEHIDRQQKYLIDKSKCLRTKWKLVNESYDKTFTKSKRDITSQMRNIKIQIENEFESSKLHLHKIALNNCLKCVEARLHKHATRDLYENDNLLEVLEQLRKDEKFIIDCTEKVTSRTTSQEENKTTTTTTTEPMIIHSCSSK